MIEIEDPPNIQACASCGSVLIWLYSYRTGRTFSAVPVEGDPAGFRAHECRHAQHGATWRQLPHGSPPSEEYLAAKAEIKKRTDNEEQR